MQYEGLRNLSLRECEMFDPNFVKRDITVSDSPFVFLRLNAPYEAFGQDAERDYSGSVMVLSLDAWSDTDRKKVGQKRFRCRGGDAARIIPPKRPFWVLGVGNSVGKGIFPKEKGAKIYILTP
jgi:hypothetical protein